MSVIDTIKALAITVRNEKKKDANSAIRVGDLFLSIIDFIKGLVSGQIRQDGVDTYNDTSDGKTSLLNTYPNPELGWTVLVRSDETNGGKSTLQQWNGSQWVNLETSVYISDILTKLDIPKSKNWLWNKQITYTNDELGAISRIFDIKLYVDDVNTNDIYTLVEFRISENSGIIRIKKNNADWLNTNVLKVDEQRYLGKSIEIFYDFSLSDTNLNATSSQIQISPNRLYSKIPDLIQLGYKETDSIVYDTYGNITSCNVLWNDNTSGQLFSTDFDPVYLRYAGYRVYYGTSGYRLTQPAVTFDSNGNIIAYPSQITEKV